MIYWLIDTFKEPLQEQGLYKYLNVFTYITFRTAMAVILAFLVSVAIAPRMIKWLTGVGRGDEAQFDHDQLNKMNEEKRGTPIMGGLIIVISILASSLLFCKINWFVVLGLFSLIWLTGVGAFDDWMKLRVKAGKSKNRDGLRMLEKLLFQVGMAVILSVFLYNYGAQIESMRLLNLPFYKHGIAIAPWVFGLITVLTITGSSNGVNLTDGMDGLAIGCIIMVAMVFLVLAYLSGHSALSTYLLLPSVPGSGELAVICGAVIGAGMGFLWFNCHPAQIFMGDTGSLPLGGLLGYVAVATRQEMLLLIAGGVFAWEALSVILQVGVFKMSRGQRRLFRCAPYHHHLHLKKWKESQVVVRLWLIAAICGAAALATVKLR